MSGKNPYKTRQREELLAYLESAPGQHITAADITEHFRRRGRSIGTATVYRQLERMVDEGLLNKYIIDMNSPACFEYMGPASHAGEGPCFHCKCERCGRLLHLHCEELEGLSAHIAGRHGFQIDPLRTVFYGLCEDCREARHEG